MSPRIKSISTSRGIRSGSFEPSISSRFLPAGQKSGRIRSISMDPKTAAIQASYDRVATEYAGRFFDELAHKPLDRALLNCFAEQVQGRGPVADLGCGPGQIA